MSRDTFRGPAYRQCHPDHTGLDETFEASRAFSFRFNPANEFGALYVALTRGTAAAELLRRARLSGMRVQAFAPRVMLTLDMRLSKVLDLTDPAIRRAWDVTLEDLAADEYGRCQEVARIARREGYEAIRYPSAAGEGENLAIFYDRRRTGSYVVVTAREDLPLDDR